MELTVSSGQGVTLNWKSRLLVAIKIPFLYSLQQTPTTHCPDRFGVPVNNPVTELIAIAGLELIGFPPE